MTAKEYLSQIRARDRKIERNLEELNDIREKAFSVTSHLNPVKVQTSGAGDKIGSITAEALDLENEIEIQISDYLNFKHKIINQIQALEDPDEMEVLFLHYVEFESFDDIATETGFCVRNIHYIHGKALKAFQEMFSDLLQDGEENNEREY